MKKIFLATILSLFAVAAMAQVRPTFIISGGYQGANLSLNEKDNSFKMRSGFRVGGAVDIVVADLGTGEISIQPGLNYSLKGAQETAELLNVKTTYKVNLGYIDLPILANFRFGVTPDMNVFVNAGPYLAYGISSNSSTSSNNKTIDKVVGGVNTTFDAFKDAFKKDGRLKPFDAGLQVGAGAEYKRVMLSVGAQLGLNNMIKKPVDNEKMTNTSFFATVGYRF